MMNEAGARDLVGDLTAWCMCYGGISGAFAPRPEGATDADIQEALDGMEQRREALLAVIVELFNKQGGDDANA